MYVANLWKFAFFVDQSEDVHRLDGDQVEGFLVVYKLDLLPVDRLVIVFLLRATNGKPIFTHLLEAVTAKEICLETISIIADFLLKTYFFQLAYEMAFLHARTCATLSSGK